MFVILLKGYGRDRLPHNESSNHQLTCVNYIKREAATNETPYSPGDVNRMGIAKKQRAFEMCPTKAEGVHCLRTVHMAQTERKKQQQKRILQVPHTGKKLKTVLN